MCRAPNLHIALLYPVLPFPLSANFQLPLPLASFLLLPPSPSLFFLPSSSLLIHAVRCLPPRDRTAWMIREHCNGRYPPAIPLHDITMQSTISTIKVDPERRLSQHSLPDTPSQSPSLQTPTQIPAKLRRRASQGSLRTKPSPVSRFLSKGSVAVHFPSWEHRSSSPGSPLRVESRNRSTDSRLRLSTTVSRGPRPLTASSTSSTSSASSWTPPAFFQDYPTTLPPTPPDDDSPVAWNPKSDMLLFDTHKHPGPAMMHDGPGMDTSSATGPSDTLSSPSDGLSHGSSSSGGSPGPHDEMMDCQQDVGSWLDHGINVTGKMFLVEGMHTFSEELANSLPSSVIIGVLQSTRRCSQDCFPDPSLPTNIRPVDLDVQE